MNLKEGDIVMNQYGECEFLRYLSESEMLDEMAKKEYNPEYEIGDCYLRCNRTRVKFLGALKFFWLNSHRYVLSETTIEF